MEQAPFIATIAAVIIALVAVFKGAGLPAQWAPLLSVILGVGASYAAVSQKALISPDPFTTGLTGIIIGVTAAGTYDGVRTTVSAAKSLTASTPEPPPPTPTP